MSPLLLPTLNAVLNSAAAVCLCLGFAFIRQKRIDAHRKSMLAAFAFSCLFLVSYLVHHARVGSVPFRGTAAERWVYFAILVPHVALAAAVVPLALITISRGVRNQVLRHKAIAQYTLPIWLYVSVSGVVIYWMLYQM